MAKKPKKPVQVVEEPVVYVSPATQRLRKWSTQVEEVAPPVSDPATDNS